MNSNNEIAADRTCMRIERSIVSIPFRTAGSTWKVIAAFLGNLVNARGYVRSAEMGKALIAVSSLARSLITRHALEGGRIAFGSGDLRVEIVIRYGDAEAEDDLRMPPIQALGDLSESTRFCLTFFTVFPIHDPFFEPLLKAEIGDLRLAIRTIETPKPPGSPRQRVTNNF